MVLISDKPFEPAFTTERPVGTTECTLGVNFVITGIVAASITHSTTMQAISGSCPTVAPMPRSVIPCGQPKFNSIPCAPVSSVFLINSAQLFLSLSAINETIIALPGYSFTISLISFKFRSSGRSLMSSILFSPITFSPLKSTAEYLDDTFFICEPSVFHTTPPQPASNARFTLYFLSVGGALANQYGFGDFIPKKVEVMSAIEIFFTAKAQSVAEFAKRLCVFADSFASLRLIYF